MSEKAHGTSEEPVQKNLRWNCDFETADRICNFNRHYAEYAGYWQTTDFLKYIKENPDKPIDFYDSVTGNLAIYGSRRSVPWKTFSWKVNHTDGLAFVMKKFIGSMFDA